MDKVKIAIGDKKNLFDDNGTESIIYYYKDYKDLLLKYYRTEDENIKQKMRDLHNPCMDYPRKTEVFPKELLKEKEEKIETIADRESLKDEVKINDLAYENNKFCGYIMKKEDLNFLDQLSKRKKKIALLKLIREKIPKLNADGIFIGDFNERNFLTDKDVSIVKICDLDNLKIDNFDFDKKHKFIQMFESKNINPEYVDSYCFNLFTLSYLSNIYQGYFSLKDYKLPLFLRNKENKEILESIKHLDNTYVPKYIIDNIR